MPSDILIDLFKLCTVRTSTLQILVRVNICYVFPGCNAIRSMIKNERTAILNQALDEIIKKMDFFVHFFILTHISR